MKWNNLRQDPAPPPSLLALSGFISVLLLLSLTGFSTEADGNVIETAVGPNSTTRQTEAPVTYEAEDAMLTGVEVDDQFGGFTGSGYAAQFDQVGDSIEFSINVPRQDYYTLRLRYLNGEGTPAVRTLLLDGVEVPGPADFRTVYDQVGPDPGGEWLTLDESLRLQAGEHTVSLAFRSGDDQGNVLIDSLQVLDETTPSVTSTRSLLMNNWTDLVAMHYSSQLNPGFTYDSDEGPRLGALHWKGDWPRSQVDSAAAFFRDETSGMNYTDINQFDSNLYFDADGIMHVDYLDYGDEAVPVAIRKEYAMVPNEPILLARYSLENRTMEDRDFSLMELVELGQPENGSQVQTDWLPQHNAWIAKMGQGAFLVFGAFASPASHGSGTPSDNGSDLLSSFEDAGVLQNNDSFTGNDVDMAVTHSDIIASGQERQYTFYYSVQSSREDAEAVAGRILAAGSPQPWFEQTRSAWQDWLATGRANVDSGDPGIDKAYTLNLIVLRQCQQPEFGSFVASTNPAYFHKVWPRDSTVSAISLDAAGYFEQAEKFWLWMAEVQEEGPGNIQGTTVEEFPNGTWYTNYSYWQLDEPIPFVDPEWDSVGQFLIGVYHHWRLFNEENPERAGQFLEEIYPAVVDSAEWIAMNVNPEGEGEDAYGFGPPGYSVWEEDFEYATYTQVTFASGLNAARLLAQEMGETERAQEWLADAVIIRDNMLQPVDSEPCGGLWDPDNGYFIRGIFSPLVTGSGECVPDRRVDGSSDLLWVFGLLPATDDKARAHRQKVLDVLTPPYEIRQDAPVQPDPPLSGREEPFGLGISRYQGDNFYYSAEFSPGGQYESTVPMATWPWMSSYMSMAEHWLGMDELSFARLQWYVSVSGVEYMPTGEGIDWNTQQPLPSTMSQPDDAGYNIQVALLNYLDLFDPRLPPLEDAGQQGQDGSDAQDQTGGDETAPSNSEASLLLLN
ncbi:MAG: CBM35 domain-containing protein [Desulfocurvibacter africanus]